MGIIAIDSDGTERGSFVTFDETKAAMMSLDNVGGHMAAQLGVGPAGGARLLLRDETGGNLRIGPYAAGPYVHLTKGEAVRTLTMDGLSPDAH